MRHDLLNVVVLARDIPERGLKSGDMGTVVDVYEPGEIEVEFATHLTGLRCAEATRIPAIHPAERCPRMLGQTG
jgi:hypothetical protein